MKEKKEKGPKYYVAYNAKNGDIGIFEGLYNYRIAREQYSRNHKGRITKAIMPSLNEAADLASDIIKTSFYPHLTYNMLRDVSMGVGYFINIKEATKHMAPYSIDPSFVK